MTRTTLILSAAAVFLLSVRVNSQEPGGDSGLRAHESRFQLVEAEIEIRMRELELMITEHAVEEATVEFEKCKLRVDVAEEQGDSREQAHAKLELKQAAIRVEMQKVESEMARLNIKLARARLELMKAARADTSRKPTRVQIEYVDESDVVVIRGAKGDVERMMALIRDGEKDKKGRE